MTKYTPTGDYFYSLVDAYVPAYREQDNAERGRLMRLMKAEFERQREETDRQNRAIDMAEEILSAKTGRITGAFAYTWRGLMMDIEWYASEKGMKNQ